jgi:hypothetical protein
MRGAGEGYRPYAPIPESTMTNGAASGSTVAGIDGSTIVVRYKDGEKKIVVPPNVPIVRHEIGSNSDLKTGARFTVLAGNQEAGWHAGGKPHQRRSRRHRASIVVTVRAPCD